MYSFLVYAAKNKQKDSRQFDKALEITKKLMPSLGCTIKSYRRDIPQINGGWFYIYPEEITEDRFVTEYADDQLSVIVFGNLIRPSQTSIAQIVAEAWKTGRADAVRNLDGIFGAVIIDLTEKYIHILSDLMGLRTLTYFDSNDFLLVSPHDIPIAATGLCPIEYDITSASSIVACDWSLCGKSLLKKLTVTDPNTHTVWKDGKTKTTHKPLIIQRDRIQPNDNNAIRSNIDRMIEKMQADAKHICKDAQKVDVQLTAGMDSRTVAAILLSVIDKSRIHATTGGAPGNMEVNTAARIAEKYNFHHTYITLSEKSANDFQPFSKLLAFHTNGTTNSKGSLFGLPKPLKQDPPMFSGNAGEVYCGFYAPSPLHRPPLKKYSTQDLIKFLQYKLPRIDSLQWSDSNTKDSILSRLSDSILTLENISSNPHDILNLFYLYERFCRWGGSGTARKTYLKNRFSLFSSPALAKMAYKLPAPISQNSLLHRTIIRKYIPQTYKWRINKIKYMPLYDHPKIAKAFAESMIRLNKAAAEIKKRLPSKKQENDFRQLRKDIFATKLADTITDMLLSNNSLSQQILTKSQLQKILDQNIKGTKNNIQTIGFLVTIEQYKKWIEKAAQMAKNG